MSNVEYFGRVKAEKTFDSFIGTLSKWGVTAVCEEAVMKSIPLPVVERIKAEFSANHPVAIGAQKLQKAVDAYAVAVLLDIKETVNRLADKREVRDYISKRYPEWTTMCDFVGIETFLESQEDYDEMRNRYLSLREQHNDTICFYMLLRRLWNEEW